MRLKSSKALNLIYLLNISVQSFLKVKTKNVVRTQRIIKFRHI